MEILKEEKLKLFKDSSSGKYYVYKDGKFKEVKINPSSSSVGGGKGISISIPSEENNNNNSSNNSTEQNSQEQNSQEQDSKENKSSSSSKSSSKDKKDDNKKDSGSSDQNGEPEEGEDGNSSDNQNNKSSNSSPKQQDSEPSSGGGKDDNIEPYKDSPSKKSDDDKLTKNSSSNNPQKPLSIGDQGDNAEERNKKWDAEEDAKEREERVAKIKKILDDPDQMNDAVIEITRVAKKSAKKASNPNKENNVEAALNKSGYTKGRSLKEFQQSLVKMVRKQIAPSYETTYSRLNKKYNLKSTGVLMPGTRENTRGKIPLIDVYFDVSGSCRPYVDLIQNYISILNGLEQKNKIKIDLYYCASTVTKNIDAAGYSGANADQIMNNIASTGADNVIIITDSDPDGSPSSLNIEVKGCVWFIWVHGRYSNNLLTHLRGRAGTESFTIAD